MYRIIYNPLSKNYKKAHKFYLENQDNATLNSILALSDIEKYFKSFSKRDVILIFGGDGTLNKIVNSVNLTQVKASVMVARGGTGNDFLRGFKDKTKAVDFKANLKYFGQAKIGSETFLFLNGVGIGIDGEICRRLDNMRAYKIKSTFAKVTIATFFRYKPFSAKVLVDGVASEHKNCFLASVMHGPYFGGGMKIAPMAKREDFLYLVLVAIRSRVLLLLLFPFIYLGWHTIFKRFVKIFKGKEITIETENTKTAQVDGEVFRGVSKIETKVVKGYSYGQK